ncbi:YagK/YfjJ domain-containing protein [Catenovulum agarivorans]|uniref:YagK/YfjJ domain-containing protein n=1 Tax=Catenovulum agarivorans TaxID=1172192 RepID=UPI0009E1BDE1|nr:inovirus-type Gp2 protein [Catenovulum agarivorans]
MQKRKRKNTTGRKYISMAATILHRGELIPVNASGSGCYTNMLKKSFEQFDVGLDKWKRQILIMIELHQEHPTNDNKRMTIFRKRLMTRITAHYGITEIGYCWVREQEKAKAQHYHVALWVDGDKVKTSHIIAKFAREVWEDMGGFYSVNRRSFIYVDSPETRLQALHWFSYLSKGRGKGYKDAQTNDYSTSRLKPT